jgi:hypothetical protein
MSMGSVGGGGRSSLASLHWHQRFMTRTGRALARTTAAARDVDGDCISAPSPAPRGAVPAHANDGQPATPAPTHGELSMAPVMMQLPCSRRKAGKLVEVDGLMSAAACAWRGEQSQSPHPPVPVRVTARSSARLMAAPKSASLSDQSEHSSRFSGWGTEGTGARGRC